MACAAPSSSSPIPITDGKPPSQKFCAPPGSDAACTPCAFYWLMWADRGAVSSPPSSALLSPRKCRQRRDTMATGRRPTPPQSRKTGRRDGRHRARHAGLHGLPQAHRTKLHSRNPIECLNHKIKRRADVVAICPNEAATHRLVVARSLLCGKPSPVPRGNQ